LIHRFKSSLQHEREQASKADAFYRNVLKASDIKRFNTDSDEDMEMQHRDVDVLLTLNNVTYRISEKFRDKDYGDLYVEVYSKFPKTVGWLHSGTANAILYFTPNNAYWITHKSLQEFCLNTLFPIIPFGWYEEVFQTHKSFISKQLKLNDKTFKINIIQAHNHEGCSWETIGISASFTLFEEYNVKIKKFKL